MKLPSIAGKQLVVALEGADRLGKTTQIWLLADFLRAGFEPNAFGVVTSRVEVVKSPVQGAIYYERIYEWLRDGRARSRPEMFQFMQVVNRLDWTSRFLQEAACTADLPRMPQYYLLLDRWNASTYAYGQAAGLSRGDIDVWMEALMEPDLTIVLDGKGHGAAMPEGDSYERDRKFQQDVRGYYLDWAARHPAISKVVSADGTVDEVAQRIREVVAR